MRGSAPCWRWITAGCGALLAFAAITIALTWNKIFDRVFASQLALTPNSRSFNEWLAPSVPLYFDVYLYNWTNAESFPEEIPDLEQLGPYSFREQRKHTNVTWHPHNGTISYRTHRTWHFDPYRSNGTLEDDITTLNIIAASAMYKSRDWGMFRQKYVSMGLAMFGQRISITRSAGELLFDGYDDPLLDMAKSLPASTTGGAPQVDKFALFFGRNDTFDTDGFMEVTTGVETGTPGQILRWNYEDHLPFYSGACSKLRGSAGEYFSRNLDEESSLPVFVPDLCRSVDMEYVESGFWAGLPYNKYAMATSGFDNSPHNSCFCNGECGWSGVMNVSACRFGGPAFISLPHFLHADPQLRTLVKGMDPDPDRHSFHFAIEPKLGIPLDVAARFQFNVFIEPNSNVALYENVPKMLFPIFWVEQRVKTPEEITAELRTVRAILDWGATVCACTALAFGVLVAVVTCCTRRPHYTNRDIPEKLKDESEMKLNPI